MKDGLLDWDCAESINIPDMERALTHIRSEGTFPVSKQYQKRIRKRKSLPWYHV